MAWSIRLFFGPKGERFVGVVLRIRRVGLVALADLPQSLGRDRRASNGAPLSIAREGLRDGGLTLLG